MCRLVLILLPLFIVLSAQAQNKSTSGSTDKLSPGAALLFKDVKTSATTADKNKIFKELNLQLSPDKKSLIMAEYPVTAAVYPTDMNNDGQEEMFLVFGSVALFGNTGEGFNLFMKDKAGSYQAQKDFAGSGNLMVLSAKNLGYPDLLIGGPGFECPAYRWNGKSYKYHRQVKDAALNNNNWTDLAAYSKTYTDSR